MIITIVTEHSLAPVLCTWCLISYLILTILMCFVFLAAPGWAEAYRLYMIQIQMVGLPSLSPCLLTGRVCLLVLQGRQWWLWPEETCKLHLTLAGIPEIMYLTLNISNLKKYSMCCGLYLRLSLKSLPALSLAYFCSAWACWPSLVPKAGVINQDGALP